MTSSIAPKLQVALININRGWRFRAIKQVSRQRGTGATDECGMESVLAVARRFRYSARRVFVPDIVPIAFAEEPQPGWAVQLAFLLRSMELMTVIVALLALVLLLGTWAMGRLRRGAL